MRELMMKATSGDMSPQELSESIRNDDRREMQYRRGIVGLSLIGMAAMGIVSLLQTGIVKKLPDPKTKTPHFDTEKVNTSKEAYSYGMPDAPLVLVTHATNIAIAAAGPADRYENRSWLPIAAVGLALPQALMAAKYLFYQMPKVDKAWCPYCVVDALTHFATLALTLPEAARAAGLSGGDGQRRNAALQPA
jgi:uncharacterized membrane protein